VAGIIALIIANMSDNADPTPITVPAVVGLTEEAAKTAITDLDLIYDRAEEPSDTVAEGLVIRTEPAEGTPVEPESAVKAIISTGPTSLAVPDVAGRTEQEATDILTDAGLTVSANRQDDDNPAFPQGQVTKTDPASGTSVSAGSAVTLFVSTGNVLVPDVAGKTKAEATTILNDAKLQVNTSPVESASTPDTVVAQDVPAGTPVKQGRVINLQIAVAPTTATIPNDLVGKTYDQVVQQLQGLGLSNFKRVDEPSERPTGEVLWTDPAAGDEVPRDQQIDIHVSKGQGGNQPSPTNTQKP
jgi:serine/threonine-protein kinase